IAGRSFAASPQARDREHDPGLALFDACYRCLYHQLVDEQKWHPRFQIIKQLLERALFHLAAYHQSDPAIFRIGLLQLHLRRENVAADPVDRSSDALKQSRAGNGKRLSFEKGGAGGSIAEGGTAVPAAVQRAALELRKHVFCGLHARASLADYRERDPGDGQQDTDKPGKDADRDGGAQRSGGGPMLHVHARGEKTGMIRASMLNRSPVSDGARVVGAKKVALVKCRDCSIRRISEGASRVTPVMRSLSPSMRNSV